MSNGKSVQEFTVEGQKHLEDTIEAAFQIISSMNDELCNPALWFPTGVVSSHSSNDVNGDASDPLHQSELGGGALEDARLRYKSAVTSMGSVLTAILSHPKVRYTFRQKHMIMVPRLVGGSESGADQAEIEKLQDQLITLRKEVAGKNKHVKLLRDQFRELMTNISTWQS